jgi:hypothetical protein
MSEQPDDTASTRPRARRRLWLGGLALILAVALVPVWLGWDRGAPAPAPTTDPTPIDGTDTPDDDAAPSDDGDPAELPDEPDPDVTAQPDITPAPLPTPDPATVAALTGSAAIDDPAGDVLDSAGEPAGEDTDPVDLRRVELEGDGAVLDVTWTVAETVPASTPGSLLWSVDLWSDEELAASLTVQLVGARLVAGVLDWSTGEQTVLPDGVEVDGETVRLVAPLGALPRIDGAVTWTALGQADGGLEDIAPEEGRAPFPG